MAFSVGPLVIALVTVRSPLGTGSHAWTSVLVASYFSVAALRNPVPVSPPARLQSPLDDVTIAESTVAVTTIWYTWVAPSANATVAARWLFGAWPLNPATITPPLDTVGVTVLIVTALP
jgi:hypothetical protein